MELPTEIVADVAVVTIDAESLDAANSKQFKALATPVLDANPRAVLDLSGVRFVDSSGLAALLYCLRRVEPAAGDVKLCGLGPPVRTLFELVRLHRVFDICDDREHAVRAFRA